MALRGVSNLERSSGPLPSVLIEYRRTEVSQEATSALSGSTGEQETDDIVSKGGEGNGVRSLLEDAMMI